MRASFIPAQNGSSQLDDHIVHTRSLNQPGVITFPAAFTLAEKVEAIGKQFLVNAAAGYEINSRLNGAANRGIYNRGFHGIAVFAVRLER